MQGQAFKTITKAAKAVLIIAGMTAAASISGAQAQSVQAHLSIGQAATSPIGWLQFCRAQASECQVQDAQPRDVVLTQPIWETIVRTNRQVNDTIEPVSDMDQYGVEEHWAYPTTGKGDCEDYVLLKRKLLIKAGIPASALLITVVRDHKGDGHAVLTVRTDRGDLILDNQAEDVLAWHQTGYRFVKRQSQTNPNQWVMIGPATAQPVVVSAPR